MWNNFLWVVLPYLVLASFVFGHIFRYRYDHFTVTSKSSEMIEKKQLMVGSILFHIGIIFVVGGHFIGLVIPKSWTTSIGISEHMYHIVAVGIGSIFGIMAFAGMFLLTFRRLSNDRVRMTSSIMDIIVNVTLLFTLFLGMASTLFANPANPGFDYRESIAVWFRQLFIFQPDASLMANVPVFFQLHIISAFLIFALFPYTRLVHAWSVPLSYLKRSYIIYRR
ncbi:respiratory nitrate reductase subunit gamma [Listeria newyorkensis]|uniref:Respiratory nitrate reductase subunit gamma n=1 Tax=Listeria newyorkensis TaxID=1497681 RepID=A0A841Z0G3_9LIST|nr:MULTISPECIES: respiratory nitrate reductase subunit gamma [Listeria]KMT61574.1 nitrate reductase gamma chain [Listeria newyorkensis]MBC1459254.1 respiratory nitrate reductase subunit gamma [Listeria newyorkensis]PNP92275.1 respiratory nitrate reductase subunit gamma [Listeria newyorkensis]RQW66862.1 respiratory nitrate reductase subunit gamma [Listeria sp. SHR_NRA_18]SQC54936.1 Nitrate reductase-like protein narX [Listeria newyorkensis]